MKTTKEIDNEVAGLTSQLAKLAEERNVAVQREDIKTCKAGDYVVCIDDNDTSMPLERGKVYTVIENRTHDKLEECRLLINTTSKYPDPSLFYYRRFRKATKQEIEAFKDAQLLKDADARGYKVGVAVTHGSLTFTIQSLHVYRGNISSSTTVECKFRRDQKPFVFLRDRGFSVPIDEAVFAIDTLKFGSVTVVIERGTETVTIGNSRLTNSEIIQITNKLK